MKKFYQKFISKMGIVFLMALVFGVLSSGNVYAVTYKNAIPQMTSNTKPSGVAFCDNNYGGEEAFKAFDGENYYNGLAFHAWGTSKTIGTIGYEFTDEKIISAYALNYNDSRGEYKPSVLSRPTQWTFEGWDGYKWVVLDNRTVTDWKPVERRVFEINNRTPFIKYQLSITKNAGAKSGEVNLQVQELEFLENADVVINKVVLNIEPEKSKIKKTETVTANLTIDNIQNIAAEDIRIKYDAEKLEYIDCAEVDGIKLVKNDAKAGELRCILASKGKDNIANAKKILLKLNFKGIKAGEALVDVVKGRVSDGIEMEKDLTDAECGQATIIIEDSLMKDVNNSGEYTLLDLAIDGRYLGEAPTTLPQYNTDIIENKAIDDADLIEIGNQMLSNQNYKF
ncbi:hypothetical protein E4V42_13345 [Clostridium estertheticum]|uniref:Cohesin domain-containing protein n=1 Tax=Clostridium estertheticum TaxID=238834 RepID=A0A5N7J2W2_9CLOT|nr:cohesin domain-containing protein [Clostridium estertheticum]MPQ32417.1 hypothetical protein [Clostridium estertheticum]MPQ63076.1 hypothetical protein [Clostridium estertheticum]